MGAFIDSTDKLSRASGFVPANSDYTGILIFRNKSTPGVAQYKSPLVFKNAGYTAFAAIYSDNNADTYRLFVDNGAGSSGSTASVTPLLNQWWFFAYTRSGNNHNFYADGVLIGTVTVNITAVTWAEQLIGFDGFSINNFDIFCVREFNSALTAAQIIAESNNVNPILTSYANTPLQNDALDTSGNARNWTVTGVTFPFTSPIQVPLTNTSDATAFELPEIPTGPASLLSGIQITRSDGGPTNTVWFKTRTPIRDRVIDYHFYGRIGAGGYNVLTDAFYNGSAAGNFIIETIADCPDQLPIGNGSFYYFKAITNSSAASPAVLAFDLFLAQELTIAAGSIFISSASELQAQIDAGLAGLPGGIVNPATGEIINFRPFFICGESGDILPTSGKMLYGDELGVFAPLPGGTNINVYLFNSDFSQITSFVFDEGGGGGPHIRTHNESEKFYILNKGLGGSAPKFQSVDANGNLGSLHSLTGSSGCTAFAVNIDETILYLTGVAGSLNSNIKRWDIAGGVYLSDLSAAVANYRITDMLSLGDGTIVAMYFKPTVTRDFFIRRYNQAGTLLNTYTPAFAHPLMTTDPRLCYAIDNPNSFFCSFNTTVDNKHNLRQIKVSDGTFINQSAVGNVFFADVETLTPDWPVVSDSCPIIQLRVGVTPPAVFGGIYIIVPGKTNDTVLSGGVTVDLKIPDPTWRTAQLEL